MIIVWVVVGLILGWFARGAIQILRLHSRIKGGF
jgi:hypothetical protein